MIPKCHETRITCERRLDERCRAAWRGGNAQYYGTRDESVLASARDRQCGGFAATDPGLLSGRAGIAIDGGMGDVGGPCRYFQRGAAVLLASVQGLVRAAGRTGACCRRPASEPRPDDPHRRRHHGAEERTSGPEEEQVVAHSQRLRSSTGTLWPLRTDRSAGGRDARPDTGGCRRDPPCRSCLFATGPWPP